MAEPIIHFYHPFDYSYINRTTNCYLQIINALPGVRRIRLADDALPSDGAVLVYTPFIFLGASRDFYQSGIARLRAHYDAPLQGVTYDTARRYFDRFVVAHGRATAAVALMTEYDLHAIRSEDPIVDFVVAQNDFILTAGSELYDLELHRREAKTDLDPLPVAAGHAFLATRSERVISMCHTLAESEILSEPLILTLRKSRRISVPGIGYAARDTAAALLGRLSWYDWGHATLDRAVYAAGRRIPWPRVRQQLLWSHFRRSISSSRISMTCGSTSGYFVRKFLEIPALGSCLCTFNYAFLPRLGYRPGSEYLPIESPADIAAYFERVQDPEFAKQLAACTLSAANTVHRLHSIPARRSQLEETFSLIARNDFQGSYWFDGAYRYR